MTEKRFTYDNKQVAILKDSEFWLDGNIDTACNHSEICNELNNLVKENEQLKQTISKIDFAIIRKYDNSLENLFDEVYDGEYNNWIQKQLLRAKKLNDFELKGD